MGCGASTQGTDPAVVNVTPVPKSDQPELSGKQKYVGDLGAAAMVKENSATAPLMTAFIPASRGFTFAYWDRGEKAIYAAELSDTAFEKVKQASNITFGWNAVFKSISAEMQRGRVVLEKAADGQSVDATYTISSVKDTKTQTLKVSLPKAGGVTPGLLHTNFVVPMAAVVQKRRQGTEEREKEVKASRAQATLTLHAVNHDANKKKVERITPLLAPLKEQHQRLERTAAEFTSKIAELDRKLRTLHRGSRKVVLDAMYERGGPQPYQHLIQADEHTPLPNDLSMTKSVSYLAQVMKPEVPVEKIVARPPADPELKRLFESAGAAHMEPLLKALEKIDQWDMSVFELEAATGNNALFYVTYAILHKLDLIRHFSIDDLTLRRFLSAVQAGYHPNPYHNATHAADVSHVNYFIMIHCGLFEKCRMSKEELLASILAGTIHDYDHPGFNNNFHTRTGAYLSTLYNDKSILENHHLACVSEMLKVPTFNIFQALNDDQRRVVRDTMVEMVLATDMGNHSRYFQTFRRRLGERADWTSGANSREDARLAFAMSLKMADISNTGRPKHLYLKWADNIAREFYNQGDCEQRLGLPVSPFMDRSKHAGDFPKGQISFLNFIVVPMFEALAEFLPPLELALKYCSENKEHWNTHQAT